MKKFVLVAVLLLGFSVVAMAEDTPAVEIFGGYSFVNLNAPSNDGEDGTLNLNGWDTSATFNANKWAGFLVDFGGYYGSPGDSADSPNIHVYSLMFGPKIAIRKGKVTPFVQALFGYAHVTVSDDDDNYARQTDYAMAFGGGVDVNVNKTVAVRPFQLEYLGIKESHSGDFMNSLRISAGVVVKLGSR